MINKIIRLLNIKKLPIKNQLIITILFVSLIGLLISMGFGIYYSIKNFKTALIKNSLLEANLIGQYCISPLIFEDKEGADKILKNIKTIPTIKGVILYNRKGEIFSYYSKYISYTKQKFKERIEKIDFSGKESLLIGKEIFVKKGIYFHNKQIGSILLIISIEKLSSSILTLILNNMIVFIIVFFIIYLITMKIQKILSEPILNLANISKEISKNKEFSFDSKFLKKGEIVKNEIDILYSSFRDMIEQIEQRQKKLNIAIVALKESEEKYRRFFEQDVSAIFVASIEGEIVDYNSTFKKLFCYKMKKSTKNINFKELCKEEECYYKILKRLNKTKKITNEEIIMVTKDGKELITLANIFLEKEKEEGEDYIIAYLFDITKRKQFEEQFLHSQKMGSIGTFAGGIAHDFNNILTVIKGYSDIILKKIKTKEEVIYKNVSVIKQSSEKAENLIKKLLLLSKKGYQHPWFLISMIQLKILIRF
jgi:PAS domain S-box-containing protein